MKNFDFDKGLVHLSKDAILKRAIEVITLPERNLTSDVYLGLVRSIVSQQLSVKAAETIYNRFLNLFPEHYPEASLLLSLDDVQLRSVGLSRQKGAYVKNVAQFFTDHQLFDYDWSQHSNEEIIQMLTQIKGVGKWTVEMILMFVLSREDVLPVLDLGIQQGMMSLYGFAEEKKALHKKMEEIAEAWKPYRSIACLYLWEAKGIE